MRAVLVALVAALIGVAVWHWYAVPTTAEIRQELPAYPRAKLIHRSENELGYRLRRPTSSAAVQRFYAKRLEGWNS